MRAVTLQKELPDNGHEDQQRTLTAVLCKAGKEP